MNRILETMLVLALVLGVAACGGGKKPGLSPSSGSEGESGEGRGAQREKAEEPEAPRPEGPIKINDVTADELAAYKVPGVGSATAENIIAYRDEHGPFRNWEDIDKAPRVGPSMLEKLKAVGVDFGAAAAEAAAEPAADGAAGTAAAPATAGATAGPASAPSAPGGKVNVNSGGIEELCNLKGIGPAMAQKIIDYRTAHGPFKTVDELDNVSGIGPAKINGFRDQVVLR